MSMPGNNEMKNAQLEGHLGDYQALNEEYQKCLRAALYNATGVDHDAQGDVKSILENMKNLRTKIKNEANHPSITGDSKAQAYFLLANIPGKIDEKEKRACLAVAADNGHIEAQGMVLKEANKYVDKALISKCLNQVLASPNPGNAHVEALKYLAKHNEVKLDSKAEMNLVVMLQNASKAMQSNNKNDPGIKAQQEIGFLIGKCLRDSKHLQTHVDLKSAYKEFANSHKEYLKNNHNPIACLFMSSAPKIKEEESVSRKMHRV